MKFSFRPGLGQRHFYSLPVEWIKRLFDAPDLLTLNTNEMPFWSLPEEQRPFFMRVVIPYQNENWDELKRIASLWSQQEPDSADAWYYQGLAEYEVKDPKQAATHLARAISLNPRHVEVQIKLAMLAIADGDKPQAEKIRDIVKNLDADEAESLSSRIAKMGVSTR